VLATAPRPQQIAPVSATFAAAPLNWTYDERLSRYRQGSSGRFLSSDDVRQLRDGFLDAQAAKTAKLASDLAKGSLHIGQWEAGMREAIKATVGVEYVFGRGGLDRMTPKDFAAAGDLVAAQFKFLNNFAADIESGRLSEAGIAARASMYTGSAVSAYERGAAAAEDIVLPVYPGDDCLGHGRCRCSWLLEHELNGDVKATWITEASPCRVCSDHAFTYNPLVFKAARRPGDKPKPQQPSEPTLGPPDPLAAAQARHDTALANWERLRAKGRIQGREWDAAVEEYRVSTRALRALKAGDVPPVPVVPKHDPLDPRPEAEDAAKPAAPAAPEPKVETISAARERLMAIREPYAKRLAELEAEIGRLKPIVSQGYQTAFSFKSGTPAYAAAHAAVKPVNESLSTARTELSEIHAKIRGAARVLIAHDQPADIRVQWGETFTPAARAKLQQAIDDWRYLVGPGVVDGQTILISDIKIAGKSRGARPYYVDGAIVIKTNDTNENVVHELSHWLQERSYAAGVATRAEYAARTRGEQNQRLGAGYDSDEVSKFDKFADPYMGKDYGNSKQHELLSMSVQLLYRDPSAFFDKDPQSFEYVMKVLHPDLARVAPVPLPATLEQSITSGIKSEARVGKTAISAVVFEDGTTGFVRRGSGATQEMLSYDVARAVGTSDLLPETAYRAKDNATFQRRIDGMQTALEALQFDPTAPNILEQIRASTARLRAVIDSPDGVRLGKFDYITAQGDRHTSNWLVGKAGEVRAIDHSLAFVGTTMDLQSYGVAISPFAQRLVGVAQDRAEWTRYLDQVRELQRTTTLMTSTAEAGAMIRRIQYVIDHGVINPEVVRVVDKLKEFGEFQPKPVVEPTKVVEPKPVGEQPKPPAESTAVSQLRESIKGGSQTSQQIGTSNTYAVTFIDGTRAMLHETATPVDAYAYRVATALGIEVLLPATIDVGARSYTRVDEGMTAAAIGAKARNKPESTLRMVRLQKALATPDGERLGKLDYITGQSDRHLGTWSLTEQKNVLRAIDQRAAFGEQVHSPFTDRLMGRPMDRAEWYGYRVALETAGPQLGIPKAQFDAMIERVRYVEVNGRLFDPLAVKPVDLLPPPPIVEPKPIEVEPVLPPIAFDHTRWLATQDAASKAWRATLDAETARAFDQYRGNGEDINSFLRGDRMTRGDISTRDASDVAATVDRALQHSTLTEPAVARRDIQLSPNARTALERFRSLREGDVLQDTAFLSTTLDPAGVMGLGEDPWSKAGLHVRLTITVPAGSRGALIDQFDGNQLNELLLPRNTRLEVRSVTESADHLHLNVEVQVMTDQPQKLMARPAELPTLTPLADRAFRGKPVPQESTLTKQQVGAVGEDIALAYLRQVLGETSAIRANEAIANFPVDLLIPGQGVIEVKTGNIGNQKGSQQWRLTIGEPSAAEKALIATMTPAERSAYNDRKEEQIVARKEAVMQEIKKANGGIEPTSRTLTVILDPDRHVAEVYLFEGFHARIGWTSAAAERAYVGTFAYDGAEFAAASFPANVVRWFQRLAARASL
jgi:hypothetical protein